jgi:hypothetical protein
MVAVLFGVIFCALYLWFPFSKWKRSSSPVDTMITQLVRWSFYAGVFSLCLNGGTVTLAVGWDWLLRDGAEVSLPLLWCPVFSVFSLIL